MPPKILIKMPFTFGSLSRIRNPAATVSFVAPPPTSRKFAGSLPATDDPALARVQKIRERDMGVIDTVDGYYGNFSDKLQESYGAWRRTSYDAIQKEDKARSQARTRTVLGAAAVRADLDVLGARFVAALRRELATATR